MIKVEKGTVSINGTKDEVCSESVLFLKALKEAVGCKNYNHVLKVAEMPDEEIENASKRIMHEILEKVFVDMLNHAENTDNKKPDDDILKDLREAMKREREE